MVGTRTVGRDRTGRADEGGRDETNTGAAGGGNGPGRGGGAGGGRAGGEPRGHHRRGSPAAPGPEAGVWVIAETGDLPTTFRKNRGDRRRRPLPAAGAARGELLGLGAGLRARRLDAGDGGAGGRPAPDDGRRRHAAGGRRGLSRRVLALADRAAGGGRVPGHRPRGQRHQRGAAHPRRVPLQREGLPALPPGRRRVHARAPRRARLRLERRRVGRARAHGAARGRDEHVDVALRPRARAAHVRRLERPHRHRRGAAGAAAARGGSSATWSSPSGSGPTRWGRSTTRRPPTSATRR